MPQPHRSFRTRPSARASAGTIVVVLALTLAACGGGGKKSSGPPTTEKPAVLAVKTSVLKVGSADIESAGPQAVPIDPATGKVVLGIAQAYIDAAIFAPLKTGKLGPGYAAVFDPGVRSAAVGSDQPALTDLAVGKATALTTKASPVGLSAFEGGLNELEYVATNFDLTIKATTASGPATITHHIELTFAQTGKAWLVTAYRVLSSHTSAAGTTTTTATGGTTP